jgi:hypothetical protein
MVADEDFDENHEVEIKVNQMIKNDANHLCSDWKFYGFSRPMARDMKRKIRGSGEVAKMVEERKASVNEEKVKVSEVSEVEDKDR